MLDHNDRRLKARLDTEAAREQAWYPPAKRSYDHFLFPEKFPEALRTIVEPVFNDTAGKIQRTWHAYVTRAVPAGCFPLDLDLDPARPGPGHTALCVTQKLGVLSPQGPRDPGITVTGDPPSGGETCVFYRGLDSEAPGQWLAGERMPVDALTQDQLETLILDFFDALCERRAPAEV